MELHLLGKLLTIKVLCAVVAAVMFSTIWIIPFDTQPLALGSADRSDVPDGA